ncbi:DUF4386 domain-containing protein [Micrococcaceae bacterium Sec5.7]
MKSPKRLARIAGVLYLAVAIFAAFGEFLVRASVYVPGDAAATADRIAANPGLIRIGFMADLAQVTCFLFVSMALYLLLRHVSIHVAQAMVIFVAVSVAMQSVNLVPYFAAMLVATDASYPSALGADGADALVLLLVDMHHYGFLIAQVFFGLWLLPLGYLAFRSGMFPRALGVLLMIACFSYLIHLPFIFLWPGIGSALTGVIAIPAATGELWMVFCLLIRGVKVSKQSEQVPAAA